MTKDEQISISITLSPAQIDEVVRAASSSRAPSISTLIANSLSAPLRASADVTDPNAPTSDSNEARPRGGYMPDDTTDPRLSRSLLRGLALLTGFGPDGEARGIVELAGDVGMSPSTAHRYALTLVELGLLERCPKTRKYRLPGT
jgi:IclR-like helix-turn-helix domain-containing protein